MKQERQNLQTVLASILLCSGGGGGSWCWVLVLTINYFQIPSPSYHHQTDHKHKCFTCHEMTERTKFLTGSSVWSKFRIYVPVWTVSDNNKCLRRKVGSRSLLLQPLSQDGHAVLLQHGLETQMEAVKSQWCSLCLCRKKTKLILSSLALNPITMSI